MRLTTKGRYAVTAMIDLALNQPNRGSVTLKTIAENQQMSVPYLEQLFAKLKSQGLVRGVRGPNGGYRLMRSAEDISIFEIINAVDESVDATRCDGRQDCLDGEICLTHELWTDLSNQMSRFLSNIKLANVIESPKVQEVAQRQFLRNNVARAQQKVTFDHLEPVSNH